VCTYTNVAVDNLVEGFVVAGVTPLRVGFGTKVKASLAEYSLEYHLDKHPLKPKVDRLVEEQKSLEKRRAQLEKKVAGVQKDGKAGALDRLERMRSALVVVEKQAMSVKSKLYAMHQGMLRDIASAADVVSAIVSFSVDGWNWNRSARLASPRRVWRSTCSTSRSCFWTRHRCRRSLRR